MLQFSIPVAHIKKVFFFLIMLSACSTPTAPVKDLSAADAQPFDKDYVEKFADLRVIQYDVPGFELLSVQQKKLVYYLSQAALSGRDIFYDQNYKYNLLIRKTLENIMKNYDGNRENENWAKFDTYAKRVWYSNGIHHHYSETKIIPEFPAEYLDELVFNSPKGKFPMEDEMSKQEFIEFLKPILFDATKDGKRVNKAKGEDLVMTSASNYYQHLTQTEAEAFYADVKKNITDPEKAPLIGLNSRLVKLMDKPQYAYRFASENPSTPMAGDIVELPWCVGGKWHPTGLPGLYSEAIEQIVFWLEKAKSVAETPKQKEGFDLLIEFYRTGDLRLWDDYNIAWLQDTASQIDYINGFIEVYKDPLGMKGYYESVVQVTDQEASLRIKAISAEAKWFEENSPIMDEHKKKDVKGVSAKVITVAQEAGATAPNTPIGINLPNSNWIRQIHGSKSVSLDNIKNGYNRATSGGMLGEFAFSDEERNRAKEHGVLAGKLHTDMHEVIGHASGKLNDKVTKDNLKNYGSTLEEARADLVALYYLLDNKLVDMKLIPSLETGKAAYDSYMRNGLMLQLTRLKLGENIEQDHMRNRQTVASWVYEKGKKDNVVEKVNKDGKTYVVVRDYNKLRALFGQLLREIQRIISEGDLNAAQEMVETYGVKVDQTLHKEVLDRYASIKDIPYTGFIQPVMIPVKDAAGEIVDVKLHYPKSFVEQMLDYGSKYSFLPVKN